MLEIFYNEHGIRDNLLTSNLQFRFKVSAFTTLCKGIKQETISYYMNNHSNVYGLILDASKVFDCVNYCKLFRILLERNICLLCVYHC